MSLIFHIKNYLKHLFLFFGIIYTFGQVNDSLDVKNNSNENRQKLGFGSWSYLHPIPAGDGFLRKGTKGNGGINLGFNIFVFRDFYLSANLGANYFTVIDQSITGNYNKTTISHQYISAGYQFLSLPKLRSGISVSLVGDSRFKNKGYSDDAKEWTQNDSGKIRAYQIYMDYMLSDQFSIYLNYIYRNDALDIKTAPEIQSVFNNATFSNIGIGLKLYFGNKDLLSLK